MTHQRETVSERPIRPSLNEDQNLIQNHLFDTNLGKVSRYERLISAIMNFSWYTRLLTSSDHDIIPMAYHPGMFVLNFFF